jgi:hypothetical protein
VFALLIAAPSLALALLGLLVSHLERLERDQRVREQSLNWHGWRTPRSRARLPLCKVNWPFGSLTGSPSGLHNIRSGIAGRPLGPRDQAYLPDPSNKPDFHPEPQWTLGIEETIEHPLAAEAQHRASEAAALFRQVGKTEPCLKAWSNRAGACNSRLTVNYAG